MLALKWFRATPAGDYSLEETVGGYHFALKNNFLMLGLLSSVLLSLLFLDSFNSNSLKFF